MFNARGLKIYHACQYKDFKTYIELDGVPSRNLMTKRSLPFTSFETDEDDKSNGVWDKVFGNFSDSGNAFAKGQRNENAAPTPNPFGPVLFVFNPQVLLEVDDIAICLRSAGAKYFNRKAEALPTLDDIHDMFKHPNIEKVPNSRENSYIADSNTLQNRFNDKKAKTPELSCSCQNELFGLQHLHKITVDEYRIDGVSLCEKVDQIKKESGVCGELNTRNYKPGKKEIKQELADLLLNDLVTLEQIVSFDASDGLKDWANRIIRSNNSLPYTRFAKYLRDGTLLEIRGQKH